MSGSMPSGRIPTRGSQSTPQVSRVWNSLIQEPFDYIGTAFPDNVTDVYTFKRGGSGGTTIATLTIAYVDSTHQALSSLTKT